MKALGLDENSQKLIKAFRPYLDENGNNLFDVLIGMTQIIARQAGWEEISHMATAFRKLSLPVQSSTGFLSPQDRSLLEALVPYLDDEGLQWLQTLISMDNILKPENEPIAADDLRQIKFAADQIKQVVIQTLQKVLAGRPQVQSPFLPLRTKPFFRKGYYR